jgi:hypothetical protein
VGQAPVYRASATGGEGLSTFLQSFAELRDSGKLFGKCSSFSHIRAAKKRRPPRKMEVDANRGHTRGRGEVDDDQDGVPEHLKCAVCLGEGGDRVSSRARGPNKGSIGVQRFKGNRTLYQYQLACGGGSGRTHSCWHTSALPSPW